jgi:hypothetical protein
MMVETAIDAVSADATMEKILPFELPAAFGSACR